MVRFYRKLYCLSSIVSLLVVFCLILLLLAAGCKWEEVSPENQVEEPHKPDEPPQIEDILDDIPEYTEDTLQVMEIRGNNPGNFAAPVLERDGWIYYTSFSFENVRKIHSNGSGAAVLSTDENASSFNMLNDWLYYVCDAGLVKTRSDGSDREVLLERPDPYYFHYLSLVDGWLYFAMRQHGMADVGILKLPLAGGVPEKLSDDEPYLGMCVAGGWIYFDTADGDMYRMHPSGSNRTLLGNGYRPIMEGGWLYYTEEESGNQIFRMNPEDGDWSAVSADLYSSSFNVAGDKVYYVNQADDLKLHRFVWGTGGTEVVAEDQVLTAYLYENAVYYQSHIDWKIYRVTPGTTTGELLP